MVGGPTRMPIVLKFVESYVGRKIEGGVNPMECVAWARPFRRGCWAGRERRLLLDVTPLSLGLETLGGIMTPLIKKEHHDPHEGVSNLLDGGRQSARGDRARLAGRTALGLGQHVAGAL
jgi:molecular chaperone DnaK (HSP70)